jgi:hypothetical protein
MEWVIARLVEKAIMSQRTNHRRLVTVTSANGMGISKCVADAEAETYMHQRTSHRKGASDGN